MVGGFEVQGSRCKVRHLTSGISYLTSGSWHLTPDRIQHPASSIEYPVSSIEGPLRLTDRLGALRVGATERSPRGASLHFSPGFVARTARCSARWGFRPEGRGVVLNSTPSTPRRENTAGCGASPSAAESWRDMQAIGKPVEIRSGPRHCDRGRTVHGCTCSRVHPTTGRHHPEGWIGWEGERLRLIREPGDLPF